MVAVTKRFESGPIKGSMTKGHGIKGHRTKDHRQKATGDELMEGRQYLDGNRSVLGEALQAIILRCEHCHVIRFL